MTTLVAHSVSVRARSIGIDVDAKAALNLERNGHTAVFGRDVGDFL